MTTWINKAVCTVVYKFLCIYFGSFFLQFFPWVFAAVFFLQVFYSLCSFVQFYTIVIAFLKHFLQFFAKLGFPIEIAGDFDAGHWGRLKKE